MTTSHTSFIRPDENTVIWHYMDFAKFASLLEKRALFFPTLTILREADEHEGTYNTATIEASKQKPLSIYDIGTGLLREFGKFLVVNCWHMNEIESIAMWDVYLKGNPGVAIQSTVKNFDESFTDEAKARGVYIGKVNYLAEDDVIPEPDGFNALNAAIWKRKSYQYENELRAVVISRPEEIYKYNGLYVSVDLEQLIQKIVISPKSPKWFSELIFSITEKYHLNEKVTVSRLDLGPGKVDDNLFSINWICNQCNTKQEIVIEPFIVKDLLHNTTVVYSADRVQTQCGSCKVVCIIPVRAQMGEFEPNTPTDDKN